MSTTIHAMWIAYVAKLRELREAQGHKLPAAELVRMLTVINPDVKKTSYDNWAFSPSRVTHATRLTIERAAASYMTTNPLPLKSDLLSMQPPQKQPVQAQPCTEPPLTPSSPTPKSPMTALAELFTTIETDRAYEVPIPSLQAIDNGEAAASNTASASHDEGDDHDLSLSLPTDSRKIALYVKAAEESTPASVPIFPPDSGWAKLEWRQYLTCIERGSRLYELARKLCSENDFKKMSTGYVYIMRNPYAKGVKVGKAVNPRKRRGDLATTVPGLVLVRSIKTIHAFGVEALTHRIGRVVETRQLFPNSPDNEWLYLTPLEADACIQVAITVIHDRIRELCADTGVGLGGGGGGAAVPDDVQEVSDVPKISVSVPAVENTNSAEDKSAVSMQNSEV